MTSRPPSIACAIFLDPSVGLFTSITAFMPGLAFREWTDGYAILRAGHQAAMLAHKPNIVLTADTMNDAAEDGRADIVSWLVANNVEFNLDTALAAAAAEGHLHVIQFFLHHPLNDHPRHDKALIYAASGGHLSVVQELVHTTTVDSINAASAIAYAADFGHWHVVEWLEAWHGKKEDGCPETSLSVFGKESKFVAAPTGSSRTILLPTYRQVITAVRHYFLRTHLKAVKLVYD
ncbi:hypothetical protein AaE_005039 [Aphanomyces astaci]|uniref:Uncharacterized protein n=1 Tax=Aphanomyces astaci TaxID=112090 RepID=A0A6A5ANH8_APHAT|nr:hypothetical protein AaE_005039 [Aphanomyces astaci]